MSGVVVYLYAGASEPRDMRYRFWGVWSDGLFDYVLLGGVGLLYCIDRRDGGSFSREGCFV